MNNNDKFRQSIGELENLYFSNPESANNYAKLILPEVEEAFNEKRSIIHSGKKSYESKISKYETGILFLIYFIGIIFCALRVISGEDVGTIIILIAGSSFFVLGYLFTMASDISGIVFLFVHCIIGLFIMFIHANYSIVHPFIVLFLAANGYIYTVFYKIEQKNYNRKISPFIGMFLITLSIVLAYL